MAKPGSNRHRTARKGTKAGTAARGKATVRNSRVRPRDEDRGFEDDREEASVAPEFAAAALPEANVRGPAKRIPSSISGRFTMDPSRAICVGMRVHVVSGTFEGQSGVVKSLDEKGEARVALGRLMASIRLEELVAARSPSTRPVLSSSHRKISRSEK